MGTQINKLNGLDWTPDDLDKKFRHSYLYAGIKQSDGTVKRDVVYIHRAAGDDGSSKVVQHQSNGGSVINTPYSQFIVEEDRADPCISNLGSFDAFLYCWNPARQWRRGWCSDNSYIYRAPTISVYPVQFDFSYAELIWKPKHVHLDDALAEFKASGIVKGRALNNRYWLVRKTKDETIQLFRRRCFIGSFIGKKFFASKDADILQEEIKKEMPILKEKYA